MQDENQQNLFTDLGFDHTARQHILSIASWAMTVVVVAVIGYVLNIVQLLSGTKVAATRSEGFELGVSLSGGNTISSVIIGQCQRQLKKLKLPRLKHMN